MQNDVCSRVPVHDGVPLRLGLVQAIAVGDIKDNAGALGDAAVLP